MGKTKKVLAVKKTLTQIIDEEDVRDVVVEAPTVVRPSKKFRMQGKSMFLTYPRCTIPKERAMVKLRMKKAVVKYSLVACEKHEDGTDHLHAVLQYESKIDIKCPTFYDLTDEEGVVFHGNYQACRNAGDSVTYVKKHNDFVEEGVFEDNTQSVVQKRAAANKLRLETPLHELVDQGVVALAQYEQLRRSKALYELDSRVIPAFLDGKKCMWIYGLPGCGKSYYVRKTYPGVFSKSLNKWWDGYKGQEVVLLDDFEDKHRCFPHYLKIWSDVYSFFGEVKGLTVEFGFMLFIITSNYLPKDIYAVGVGADGVLAQAIERRFTFHTINEEHELVDYKL